MASTTFKPMAHENLRKNQDNPDDAFDKAKEAGKEALDKAKEGGKEALAKAGEGFDKARQAGGEALDKAKEAAQAVGQGVSQMASNAVTAVGDKAENLTAAAGHSLVQAGDTLAQKMPQGGFAGKASHMMTDALHESGKYIEEQKLTGMANDVATVVRNHPIPTMLICLGLGFCLGRAFKD